MAEARKLGFVDSFRSERRLLAGGYGPAIATGGVDVTLEEMMYGYSVLANGGIMRGQELIVPHDSATSARWTPISILKVDGHLGEVRWDIEQKPQGESRSSSPSYPFLIWDILSDPSAPCVTFAADAFRSVPRHQVR